LPKVIELPAFAADFEGGIIEEWHKQVGDTIEVGDVLADVSTDKAVIEFEAEESGTLGKILVPAGAEEVPVHSPIAILLLDGESADALDGFVVDAPVAVPPAATGAQSGSPAPAIAEAEVTEVVSNAGGRVFASPVATRIAQQLGVDLDTIEGSGPGGRIVLGDVEAAAARQGLPLRPPTVSAPRETPVELPPAGTYTEVPIDKIRRVVARRLAEAKRVIPHFYLSIDCELDNLLDTRRRLNEAENDSVRISVNDFLIKACAMALRDVPGANAVWTENAIFRFKDVDIAVAVASPKGLMTPVVRQADSKDLATISAELQELAARAREGRLKPEEYKGGGFTLSNLGMYGIREFSAIINPPQSCILAVGAAEQRPVVRNGKVTVATMLSCTLSVDHRAVDGALGSEFLQAFKQTIEQPECMLA